MRIRPKIIAALLSVSLIGLVSLYIAWRGHTKIRLQMALLMKSSSRELLAASELNELIQDSQLSVEHYLASRKSSLVAKEAQKKIKQSEKQKLKANHARMRNALSDAHNAARTGADIALRHGMRDLAETENRDVIQWLVPLDIAISKHIKMLESCRSQVSKDRRIAEAFFQNEVREHYLNEILPLLTAYRANAKQEVKEELKLAESIMATSERTSIAISLTSVLAACLLGLILARRLASPLEELRCAIDQIDTDDLSHRIELTRNDEIGGLAQSFNEMLERLQRTNTALKIEEERRRMMESAMHDRQRQLEGALRFSAVAETAATLAHELNQPLGATVTYTQTAARILQQNHDHEKVILAVHKAAEQAKRAAAIIRRLRALFDNGHSHRGSCDVSDLLTEVRELVSEEAGLAGVAIELQNEMPSGQGAVLIDRVQLQQVLVNLTRNSIECFCDPNVSGATKSIFLRSVVEVNGDLQISVADTGPGMSPTMLSRAIEPFVTTKDCGMGLGLAICRSIVEAHGGTLCVENNDGPGLTVTLSIPSKNSDLACRTLQASQNQTRLTASS